MQCQGQEKQELNIGLVGVAQMEAEQDDDEDFTYALLQPSPHANMRTS